MGIILKYSLFVCLVLGSLFSHGQDYTIEERSGQQFIVHIVEAGNTLYSIKSQYNTSVEEILEHNPNAEDGLQIGQRIFIPFSASNQQKKEQIHVVQRQETLFGISRKYGCNIDDIIDLNPEAEQGLKVGQELKIPASTESGKIQQSQTTEVIPSSDDTKESKTSTHQPVNYTKEDSIITHVVQKKETLYSISKRFMVSIDELVRVNQIKGNNISQGDTLIIPLKKEISEPIPLKEVPSYTDSAHHPVFGDSITPKDFYTIVYLLPFRLDNNPTILTGLYDDNTRLNNISEIALDFWMGAKYAIDSLEKLGLRANIHVFDTKGDKETVQSLLEQNELLEADLIIGPFFPANIELVANWVKENNKQLYLPVRSNTNLLQNNPSVHNMVPSEFALLNGLATYLAKNHSENKLVLVNDNKTKEQKEFFLHALKLNDSTIEIHETELGSSSGRDLTRHFDLDGHTLFVSLAEDAKNIMAFINTLNAAKNSTNRHGEAEVTAVGNRKWMELAALNSYYKNRFQLLTAQPNYLNYETEKVQHFVSEFQQHYKIDASKYVLQGYDISAYILSQLTPENQDLSPITNDFNTIALGERNGKENSTTFIVQQIDYDLILQGVVKGNTLFSHEENSIHEYQD